MTLLSVVIAFFHYGTIVHSNILDETSSAKCKLFPSSATSSTHFGLPRGWFSKQAEIITVIRY